MPQLGSRPVGGGQRPQSPAPGGGGGGQHPAATMDYASGQRFVSPGGARMGTAAAHGGMLGLGNMGPAVTTLQVQLTRLGYQPGPIDGDFGPLTRAAVMRFQKAKGLEVDGVVGPATRAVLADAAADAASGPAAPVATPGAPSTAPRPKPAVRPQQVAAGARGPSVILLQKELNERGFAVGAVDGDFGPATAAALRAFQRANGLEVDGVAGEHTWKALGYRMGGDARDTNGPHSPRPDGGGGGDRPPPVPGRDDPDLRQRILAHARGELGTREAGWNAGGAKKYQEYFGRGREPWCADFVSWVYTQAGQPMNNPWVPGIVQQLKKAGRWRTSNPRPGDMVIFDWDGDGVGDHIGIVESVLPNGRVRTIEGNTGDPAGRGPEGVYERSRVRSTILGYGDAVG